MNALLTALVLSSILVVPTQGGPQDDKTLIWGTIQPLECGIERVVPPETLIGNYFMENGLEAFVYDTNGDGQRDVQIMLPQGDTNRYPQIYLFDRDYDGDPDILWKDSKRDGTCGPNLEAQWIGDGVKGEKGKEA